MWVPLRSALCALPVQSEMFQCLKRKKYQSTLGRCPFTGKKFRDFGGGGGKTMKNKNNNKIEESCGSALSIQVAGASAWVLEKAGDRE